VRHADRVGLELWSSWLGRAPPGLLRNVSCLLSFVNHSTLAPSPSRFDAWSSRFRQQFLKVGK
jgi:hypothetical protein